MASTNLLQWNPGATNQDSDAAYSADAQRSGGAANPSIFDSATANKLFYQLSTFALGFAQALVAKGYTISDANVSTLAGVLANVTTAVDLAAALALYAPLASPTLTGVPLAPTPSTSDNTTKIATTAFVKANFSSSAATAGYQKLPNNGLFVQWGLAYAATGNGDILNFTLAFPATALMLIGADAGASAGVSSCNAVTLQWLSSTQFKALCRSITTGSFAPTALQWLAIGY